MKNVLQKISKKQYIWIGIGVLIIVIISIFVGRNGNGKKETITVGRHDVVEEVSVSGRVEAGTVADLGFEVSGRVTAVQVSEGDKVSQGTLLISLDVGSLTAELAQARADVLIKEAEAANAQTNLEDVLAQQDTLVQSAYRTLLSSDLEAEPEKDSITATPPRISGRYVGSEGQYKIRIVKEDSNNDYDLYVFGLERPDTVEINETGGTPLGTQGLSISFPENIEGYDDTVWYINIPNIDGSSYTSNLNSYEEALTAREVALEAAQAEVVFQQSGVSIAEAQLARARANVLAIQAEIAKRRLIAPFSGIVTGIKVDPGEIVSANTVAASLISDDGFGIEIDLPEVDSVKVSQGDAATVILDPFGDDVVFDGTVLSINAAETLLDNVAVYEARVGFNAQDERVASGMTAEVTIQTNSKTNVLAVPVRAIRKKSDGTQYVLRHVGERDEEATITTGLRGSDSFVEILSGLEEGDIITIPE